MLVFVQQLLAPWDTDLAFSFIIITRYPIWDAIPDCQLINCPFFLSHDGDHDILSPAHNSVWSGSAPLHENEVTS